MTPTAPMLKLITNFIGHVILQRYALEYLILELTILRLLTYFYSILTFSRWHFWRYAEKVWVNPRDSFPFTIVKMPSTIDKSIAPPVLASSQKGVLYKNIRFRFGFPLSSALFNWVLSSSTIIRASLLLAYFICDKESLRVKRSRFVPTPKS